MLRRDLLLGLGLGLLLGPAFAGSRSRSKGGHSSHGTTGTRPGDATHHRSHGGGYGTGANAGAKRGRYHDKTAAGVRRDDHGRIARSSTARAEFERSHHCPSTGKATGACPGYVVDHVKPLKRGGADVPSNMRWQTTEQAKAKDRVE